MTGYSNRAGLSVAEPLARFIEEQVLPGTGIEPQPFWYGVAGIFGRFAPENEALLIKRDKLQQQIDAWHEQHHGQTIDGETYQAFLREIGYLVPEPAPFSVDPRHVDEEVALRSGPQLVVPALNARFALNAANARWGSLYDALYGTDAIPGTPTGASGKGASMPSAAPRLSPMPRPSSTRSCRWRMAHGRSGRAACCRWPIRGNGWRRMPSAFCSPTTGCISRS